jgi:phosphopantetheinyl transferase (holo-ACP synthase)
MNFSEFQNQSRLYVIGALEAEELEEFEKARKKFGKKGEEFIAKSYALHEAFALSLRPAKASTAIKDRLMAMVKAKQGQ